MRRITLFFLIVLISMPYSSWATESYITSRVDGISHVVVDGDLSDWEWVNILPVNIDNLKEYEKIEPLVPDVEFSSTFQCFIDDEKLYCAFKVTDSHIVFGRSQSTSPLWDDTVEIILFDCFSIEDPETKIWVSSDSEGITKLQGREPESSSERYPYLRKKWGIEAALDIAENGYTVEISIPNSSLSELINWTEGLPLKVNVRVYNDDSDGKQIYLEWTDNPLNMAKQYNEIHFNELVLSTFNSEEQNESSIPEIQVELGDPDVISDTNFLHLREIESDLKIAFAFEKNKKYSWAIERYEKILTASPPNNIKIQSELSIARNCFFIDDYARAEQLCKTLLDSDIDLATQLDARMILRSIERKRNLDTLFK